MTISYLSKKPFKSEEFLAASNARSIPTDAALLLSLVSSTTTISLVLSALHFNDPITTTMTRAEIAAVLFIAFTEGLVKRLPGQKLMLNYNKKKLKRKAVEFLQLRKYARWTKSRIFFFPRSPKYIVSDYSHIGSV